MAITISGTNNVDKILATDGVLDSISGFNVVGVMTAATFDVTGKTTTGHLNIGSNIQLGNAGIITATTLIGNVTGNVNATSNLLLQIGGSEKFRVASSGQLGIGGANYGSSGQVLTSGGSGSAATWSTINSDKITEGNTEVEVVDTGSDGHFKVTTEGSERLRILSNGNVLIGTTVDGNQALNVYGAANAAVAIQNSNTGTGANNGIYIGNGNSTIAYIWNYENDSMRFATNNIERLRIDAGGGLQLGTSTATASKLTVYGASDAAAIFQGSSTGTGAGNGLLVGNNGGTTGLLWNYENGPVKIAAHNAEHVRIATDGSCYFGPQIITEADMNWGHDAHQRPYVFSGNQSGVNPADATIVVANPNTDPPSTRLGSFMFGCKTSSGGNSGIKAYIEGWTTSNPSNTYEAGGYIKFVTRQSAGSLTEHFKIDHDGKLYKSGNHFYPLVNYTEVTTFTAVSTSSNSYTDLRTILSGYTPKKAGNLIVIHHQSQCWQGGHANDSGDAMWKIQRQEGGGSWTDVTENDRIMGNMDGRNYTGGSGLARHHRTVHLMGSFTCNGSSFNLKSLGKVDFTSVGLQWYHHSFNILQVWEYEKG